MLCQGKANLNINTIIRQALGSRFPPLPDARRQAYDTGQYRSMGLLLQRAVLVNCLAAGALGALWSQAEPLLLLLGQDPAIAQGEWGGRFAMLSCSCFFLLVRLQLRLGRGTACLLPLGRALLST